MDRACVRDIWDPKFGSSESELRSSLLEEFLLSNSRREIRVDISGDFLTSIRLLVLSSIQGVRAGIAKGIRFVGVVVGALLESSGV